MLYCTGYNCDKNEDAGTHSVECLLEHNSKHYPDAGEKHNRVRYAAYSGAPLPTNTEGEKAAAYWQGFKARADT
jgi:hypothetical protein